MKILYVTTVGGTMSFFVEHFKMLIEEGHQVEIACNTNSKVKPIIEEMGIKIHNLPLSRSPLAKSNITAYKSLKKLVANEKYDIVHCHTPIAAAVTRLACKGFRKNGLKVFYTAHGFHFYKGSAKSNWALYFPIEWLCSFYTDTLITMNKEDFSLAKRKLHAKKIEYVHGVGVNLNKFKDIKIDIAEKRENLGIPKDAFLFLSVGELNQNKNHKIVIKALARMLDENVHYAIAGSGPALEDLKNLAKELGVENRIHLLGFRKDVAEIYQASDVYILPSFREGLNVSIMEAMANSKPVLCSRIRGNVDLVDEGNGFLFGPANEDEVLDCMNKVYNSSVEDFNKLKINSAEKSLQYDINNILDEMKRLYF